MEQESADFHDRVYEGYINEIKGSNGRIVPIKPDFDKKVTAERIINALREKGAIK
jgi:thymidylate kinase